MKKTGRDYLSDTNRSRLKNVHINLHEDKEKYSKMQYIQIYKGYDMLENIFVVRTYIQKYYDIDFSTLELLLKLMGLKVFSRIDFSELPRSFSHARFKALQESGFINLLSNHRDEAQRLYTLNTKGKNIVVNFYKYLSGEEKIPTDSKKNPMAHKRTQVAFDKKKMDLIEKLKGIDVPAHKRLLF